MVRKMTEIVVLIGLLGVVFSVTVFGEENAKTANPGSDVQSSQGDTYIISSKQLEVTVDSGFPRVIAYKHLGTGSILYGQGQKIEKVIINGTGYTPKVTSKKKSILADKGLRYEMTFPEAGNITMDASLTVSGATVVFRIDKIKDNDAFRVNTIEIPQHSIVSIRSSQPGASLGTALIDANKAKCGDTFRSITAETEVSEKPAGAAYAILSTKSLAAAIETNSIYDRPSSSKKGTNERYAKGFAKVSNGRVIYQITKADGAVSAGLWSGQWTHRAEKSEKIEPAPYVKVIITTDRNNDNVVDWQDGAIAFREIMHNPRGAERTPGRVAQHIPFNFASIAGNSFLRSLDNVKRIYYITDGLGQMVLHKGYQSEGHDSAHSDFGGNIGRRQGGKKDMNIMVNEGAKWNADFGVHLNCTESYPEAKSFSDTFVNPKAPGWGWLDQSYYIHHRQDLVTGNFAGRVKELMRDVPGLAFVYMDVYFGDGWEGLEMARTLQEAGIDVTTEFPRQIEHSAVWSHWSVDMTYGPDTSRGINSRIVRFIRNHQKDMFLKHPLLGHAEIGDFEGWQTRTNFYQFLDKVYNASLPAKYMQHFQIVKWTKNEIKFTDGVRVTDESGKRQIFKGQRLILDGGAYLLPWEPKTEKKLYHWNDDGGKTTWTLPKSWNRKIVKQYLLTDTGREFVADLPVMDGKVTIEAEAKKPYIIYPSKAKANRKPNWGQGGLVKDPGFNDRDIKDWKIDSEAKVVGIDVDEHGRTALKIAASAETVTVSQKISGLKSGVYSASVWVEVDKGTRKASLIATPAGGKAETVWTDRSFAYNYIGNSGWNRTRMQRMRVLFEVPAWRNSAMIALEIEPGQSSVRFDDVRVVPTVRTQREGYDFFEDFENVDEGWYPFVKGDAGGVTDPTTHLSERHSPYTDAGWNEKLIGDTITGDWSLKSHNERLGIVYHTIPQTVRFAKGGKYEFSFDYQCAHDDEYSFLIGAGAIDKREIISTTNFKQARTTKQYKVTVEPGEKTDVWIGVKRNKVEGPRRKEVDLVIDNVSVRDIGVTE